MTKTLYNYTYTNPAGYSYSGQVVADTTVSQYNYTPGQPYNGPKSGTYTISGAGEPTTAPSGAVYQQAYTDASGKTYDSYHYDAKDATYYNIKSAGYDHNTGLIPTANVPAWSGIGLGNEYSYVNTGSATTPNYQTYGGGGTANVNPNPTPPVAYDYKFLYPDGSYYLGKVVDDGTYGYKVGDTISKGTGTYTITAVDPTQPSATARPGYDYVQSYYDVANGQTYVPSDLIPGTPFYQKPVGYGGLGSEKDYIQKPPGGYYAFNNTTPAASSQPVTAIPLPT